MQGELREAMVGTKAAVKTFFVLDPKNVPVKIFSKAEECFPKLSITACIKRFKPMCNLVNLIHPDRCIWMKTGPASKDWPVER